MESLKGRIKPCLLRLVWGKKYTEVIAYVIAAAQTPKKTREPPPIPHVHDLVTYPS